jgi:DNA-binding transcriptional MerR regulator
MPTYTTGEMAKLCNVSVRTVQFYDTKGILHPSDLTEGGRRIYNDDDLRKFQIVCTLKAIGLSLTSIKRVLESELSGKILALLLDEQVTLLTGEINERRKQLDRIKAIRDSIGDQTTVPANTLHGIEDTMKKKSTSRGKGILALVVLGVLVFAASQLWLLHWLITSQIWWAVVLLGVGAPVGIIMALIQLKGTEFLCPHCDAAFTPSLVRAFFSTGSHKIRWAKCPACKQKNWCVLRKPMPVNQTT